MKEQLIKLATEKGFKSIIIGKSVEAKHTSKDFYYLWLCELQKWLIKEHEMHVYIIPFSISKPEKYSYSIFLMTQHYGSTTQIDNYLVPEEALERGLLEAVTLIKK